MSDIDEALNDLHLLTAFTRAIDQPEVAPIAERLRQTLERQRGVWEEQAKRIVTAIHRDFTDRRGLRQAWEGIDDDVREEIIDQWVDIVLAAAPEPSDGETP